MKKSLLSFVLCILILGNSLATELYPAISSYQADRGALARKYNNPLSDEYFQRFDKLYKDWLKSLESMPYESFSLDGKMDYQLFKNHLEKELFFHGLAYDDFKQVSHVVDFKADLEKFYQTRRLAVKPNAQEIAATFAKTEVNIKAKWEAMEKTKAFDSWQKADLASQTVEALRKSTEEAYNFYYDYDPEFTWWMKKPMESMNEVLRAYSVFLKNHFENTVVKDDGSG
ncbi:MAG: DUF885 domain-containing protein, partial [Cyclobacteriaceae bacterium]|nr:DUF885 domain-containing protein [Cyclobacteriaceae bacterium]